ncbi:hypothetical protein Tco_0337728 [Tanacetum coccineum]
MVEKCSSRNGLVWEQKSHLGYLYYTRKIKPFFTKFLTHFIKVKEISRNGIFPWVMVDEVIADCEDDWRFSDDILKDVGELAVVVL